MPNLVEENEFLSIKEYMHIARITIKKFYPSFEYLLQDIDGINYVVAKIMYGDWKYDPARNTTRKTYRCNCARWAILEYICRIKHKNLKNISFYPTVDAHFLDVEWKKTIDKIDLKMDINNIDILNDRELYCINKIFFEYNKISDIAEDLEVSRTTIYKICQKALKKLQETFGV